MAKSHGNPARGTSRHKHNGGGRSAGGDGAAVGRLARWRQHIVLRSQAHVRTLGGGLISVHIINDAGGSGTLRKDRGAATQQQQQPREHGRWEWGEPHGARRQRRAPRCAPQLRPTDPAVRVRTWQRGPPPMAAHPCVEREPCKFPGCWCADTPGRWDDDVSNPMFQLVC
jgi:hypothetical protein